MEFPPPIAVDTGDAIGKDSFTHVSLIASRIQKLVYSVVFYIIGIPGNILIIVVLRRKSLRGNFLSIYIISLAILNISLLSIGMISPFIFGLTAYEVRSYSLQVCAAYYYSTWYIYTAINWTLVCVSIIRILHLCFAWRIRGRCSKLLFTNRAAVVILFLMHVVITIYLYANHRVYLTFAFKNSTQGPDQEGEKCFVTKGFHVHLLLNHMGPIILLILGNCFLGRLFRKRSKVSSIRKDCAGSARAHLSLMVFLSGIQFVAALFPVNVYFVLRDKVFDLSTARHQDIDRIILVHCEMMLHSFNATNIFLYCFFESRFRRELIRTINRICPRVLTACGVKVPENVPREFQTCTPTIPLETESASDYIGDSLDAEMSNVDARSYTHSFRSVISSQRCRREENADTQMRSLFPSLLLETSSASKYETRSLSSYFTFKPKADGSEKSGSRKTFGTVETAESYDVSSVKSDAPGKT